MRNVQLWISMMVLYLVSGITAFGQIEKHPLCRMDSSGEVGAWQTNEGASANFVEGANRGWMQVRLARYEGTGNQWPSAARGVDSAALLDANGIGFVLHNPLGHTQMIQVNVSDADGNGASDVYRLPAKSTGTYITYFTEMSSMVDLSKIDSVSLYRTQPSSDHELAVAELFAVRDPQRPTLLRELRTSHRALGEALRQCTKDDRLPEDRLRRLRGVFEAWQKDLAKPSSLVGRVATERAELDAALAEAKSAVLRAQTGYSVIPWAGDIGRQLLPREAIATIDQPIDRLDIAVLGNAYTQGVVRLTNVGGEAAELLATIEGMDTTLRQGVVLWRAASVLAVDATVVGDALMPLDPAGGVSIAPGETAELWVRVDARHHDWPTGEHQATLKLRNLRDPVQTIELPVVFDVSGVRLADEKPLHVLMWPELYESRSNAVRGLEAEAVRNLSDYGADLMTLMPNELPWPKLDASGVLVEPTDFTLFDKRVKFYLQHMPDALFMCWLRFDIPDPDGNFELRSGLTPGSDAWRRGLETWLTEWRTHIESMGLAPSRFIFYLTDEPGPDELDRQMLFAPIARAVVPDMPLYTNASELYDDPRKDASLLTLTDIIQPDATIGFDRNAGLLETLREASDLDIWVYACRTGRRARHVNAHAYYRLQPWRAMRDGLTGIGFWAYAAAHGDPDELWNGTAASGAGATLVYRGNSQLIMSRRWELIREGLDDARLMALLKQKQTPEAEQLIADGLGEVLQNTDNPGVVQAWRQRVIDHLR